MSYNFTRDQLEHAYDVAKSASGAARLLGVKIDTYKKYAEMYGCYRKNQSGKGTHKHKKFVEDPNINIHYFDCIDSSDKAYILGFLLADGTVRYNSLRICVANKDREILEYICKRLNVDSSKIIDYTGWYHYNGEKKEFLCSRSNIVSKHIVQNLVGYGLVVDRVKNNVDMTSKVPENMMIPFISGYIDGNGTFSKSSYGISLSSNMKTCRRISEFLCNFNINNCNIYDRGNYVTMAFSGTEDFIKSYLNSNDFLLTRKRNIAQSMLLRKLRIIKLPHMDKHIGTTVCVDCGKNISENSVRCKRCAGIFNQSFKCKRPTKDQLVHDLLSRNFLKLSEKYNVSDNAIRKWCKFYGLPYSTKQLKSMTDDELLSL